MNLDELQAEIDLERNKADAIMDKFWNDHYSEHADTSPNHSELQELHSNSYKRCHELNREYRKRVTPIMSDFACIGDIMTFQEFKDTCACGGFIDYDGDGYYATETQESDVSVSPSDITYGVYREDFTHVVWYNR